MIKGFIEAISPSNVSGWAHDPESPGSRIKIVAYLGAEEIGSGCADIFRDDLASGGIGDGQHAFSIQIRDGILPEDLRDIEVRGILGDAGFVSLAKTAPLSALQPLEVEGDVTQRPIFLLGSARSGTSALASGLRSATRYVGQDEGHFFSLFGRLVRETDGYYKDYRAARRDYTTISTVPINYVTNGIGDMFKQVARLKFGTPYWVDKTPTSEMISHSPRFFKLWPKAKFIFMKRRGIENISSRTRKFPEATFASHCADWAAVMAIWLQIRNTLGSNALEIDQMEMSRAPGPTATAIGAFLDLPSDEVDALADALGRSRLEQTSTNFGATVPLEQTGWSDEDKATFIALCGPMMNAYGYSLDDGYRVPNVTSSDSRS